MANENLKKFLDKDGVSHLWGKISKRINDEKARAEGEEQRIEAKVDAIDQKIGDLGSSSTVVEYVKAATEGFETSETIEGIQADIATIKGDYVKNNQLTNLATKVEVQTVQENLDNYVEANTTVFEGINSRLNAAATTEYVDANKVDKTDFTPVTTELGRLKEIIDHFFAEESTVNDALDTLKEIVAYISVHKNETELVTSIQEIADKVNNKLDIGDHTVSSYVAAQINAAVAALNLGQYATANELLQLANRVAILEQKEHLTEQDLIDLVEARLGDLGEDQNGDPITVEEYVARRVAAYVDSNVLALTNEEINAAIGETNQTN